MDKQTPTVLVIVSVFLLRIKYLCIIQIHRNLAELWNKLRPLSNCRAFKAASLGQTLRKGARLSFYAWEKVC
jgi:hypothetical protein